MNEQHVDLDGLADLLAAGDSAQNVHLQTCAPCQERLSQLQAALVPVASSLAALPLPPEPAGLDARLTAAVASLRAKQGTAKVAKLADRRPARKLAWLPIAGGMAAAVALVFAIVVIGGTTPASDIPTETAAGPRTNNTGLAYSKDGQLLAAQLPALLNGTASGLPTDVPRQQSSPERTDNGGVAPQVAVDAADKLGTLRTTAGLASCLTALTEGSAVQLPLALDYASFDQQPALVVVLPSTVKEKVDVFVVGAACAQADANLLHFVRLNAPA